MSPSSTSRFCSTSEQAPQCRSCVLVGTSYQLVSDPRWSACCLQMATQYELQLTESRLAETKLRATCRRLESEGMFAEVFDTYEREIASLQVRCRCKSEAASDAQGLEPVHCMLGLQSAVDVHSISCATTTSRQTCSPAASRIPQQ